MTATCRRTASIAAIIAVLFNLAPFAHADVTVLTYAHSSHTTSFAGPAKGDLELRDETQLSTESFTNGALTAGTSWAATGDFALAANAATYTHSTGTGDFLQTSADAAIPFITAGQNGWFSFTHTVSAVTGSPVCVITSAAGAFTDVDVPLTEVAGTYTVTVQGAAVNADSFAVRCTSSAAATITFDDLSLKRVNGGNATIHGRLKVGNGSAALPSIAFISAPEMGFSKFSGTQMDWSSLGATVVRFGTTGGGDIAIFGTTPRLTLGNGSDAAIGHRASATPVVNLGGSTFSASANSATIGGVFCSNTTSAATTGLIEEVLATCTLPANALSADGKGVRITAWGTTAANANGKTLRLRFGGIGGTDLIGHAGSVNAGGIHSTAVVIRTGAATQVSSGTSFAGVNNSTASVVSAYTSPAADTTAAIAIVVTGTTPTLAGDLTFRGLIVEFYN